MLLRVQPLHLSLDSQPADANPKSFLPSPSVRAIINSPSGRAFANRVSPSGSAQQVNHDTGFVPV